MEKNDLSSKKTLKRSDDLILSSSDRTTRAGLISPPEKNNDVCLYEGSSAITGILGKANSHFDPTQNGVGDCITTLRQLLIGAFLLALSLPPCPLLCLSFYLKLSGRSGRNCLLFPPVLSSYNESLDTLFSWVTTQLLSWPEGERYSSPLQSLASSLFLSYPLFSFLELEASYCPIKILRPSGFLDFH